jgi:CheY-like chemotaxis protein
MNESRNSLHKEKFNPDEIIENFVKSGRTLNILVSEDESINLKYLELMFQNIGFNCDCASDGRETIAMMRQKKYDIVLLDMQMPVMNGDEVLAFLQNDDMKKDTYIIAQTAFSMPGDEEKYLSLGCNSYLSKPIDWNKLKKIIAEAIVNFVREKNKS